MRRRELDDNRRVYGCARWAGALGLLALTGCHSAFIQADVHNGTGQDISLLEVDYPSASFGTESLPAGADYNYRLKVLGNGPLKVSWTDAAHHDHNATGPSVSEGQEGRLTVTLTAQSAAWNLKLQP